MDSLTMTQTSRPVTSSLRGAAGDVAIQWAVRSSLIQSGAAHRFMTGLLRDARIDGCGWETLIDILPMTKASHPATSSLRGAAGDVAIQRLTRLSPALRYR